MHKLQDDVRRPRPATPQRELGLLYWRERENRVTCKVVGVLEWVVYEHAQALQPFNVEEETGGRRGAALEGGKPLENGEQTWILMLMHYWRW